MFHWEAGIVTQPMFEFLKHCIFMCTKRVQDMILKLSLASIFFSFLLFFWEGGGGHVIQKLINCNRTIYDAVKDCINWRLKVRKAGSI